MKQSVRDAISGIVRDLVKRTYGEPTCIATVKVLAAVLMKGWGIELSTHVVSLKIVPPKALGVMDNPELAPDQKIALIKNLPDGEKPKAIESGESGIKFHMIGLSGSENNIVFWDPSIDQVNSNFDTFKLEPISLELSESRIDDADNIVFRVHGCQLIYREQPELEETVYACDAWSINYSALSERALEELGKIIEPDVEVPKIGGEK